MASIEYTTATVIEALMTRRGHTIHSLAEASGIPYNTLKRRVRTGRGLMVQELYLIAELLDADPLTLLEETGAPWQEIYDQDLNRGRPRELSGTGS